MSHNEHYVNSYKHTRDSSTYGKTLTYEMKQRGDWLPLRKVPNELYASIQFQTFLDYFFDTKTYTINSREEGEIT